MVSPAEMPGSSHAKTAAADAPQSEPQFEPRSEPRSVSRSDQDLEADFQRLDKRTHPVDARLSVPLPGGRRVYMVLLGGVERRGSARRQRERDHHPLLTLGNVLALAAVVAVIYALALVALVAFDGMLPLP